MNVACRSALSGHAHHIHYLNIIRALRSFLMRRYKNLYRRLLLREDIFVIRLLKDLLIAVHCILIVNEREREILCLSVNESILYG